MEGSSALPLVGRREVDADDDARFRDADATHRRRQVAESRVDVGKTEKSPMFVSGNEAPSEVHRTVDGSTYPG